MALRGLREVTMRGQMPHRGGPMHAATLQFLEFVPEVEQLHLSHVSVETPRQLINLMSDKKLTRFLTWWTHGDGRMLRSMLSGQRLKFFKYNPGGEGFPTPHQDKLSEVHTIDLLTDSRQSLRVLKLYSTQMSKSPLLSQFDNLELVEMPFAADLFNVIAGSEHGDVANALRKRIPESLSALSLRYIPSSDDVCVVLAVLAELKRQGEFSALKTVRLNFCRFAISPRFPPDHYNILNPALEKELIGVFNKVGLQLEVAQTD
ncbi:uncharacterized protein EKO05_0008545 [Ascochyta rabiei]|uniref:Uncharacterized protein n=1 Tax=Didymella rabiei TaxID=5454 RepID=A0A163ML58_DIDRA|nr:uncharacterized protein EKO05_0008545 [Ascochyta rabiei]KZM28812.1 hypothetical protein ST47_g23 [Ascochyta rabiei]UPX18238.1 hypothetical protein EKO05_0008545 [Ascochyta rabiei]